MPFSRAPKDGRKEMTRTVYFCNQRQKVESHITFTPGKSSWKLAGIRRRPACRPVL